MKTKIFLLLFALVTAGFYGTCNAKSKKNKKQVQTTNQASILTKSFTFGVWQSGDKTWDDAHWNDFFKRYTDAGITDFFMQQGPAVLTHLIALNKGKNIRIHAWIETVNRPNDSIAMQHPDWYAVNRNGQNCLEYHPYVGYYQWLSPFSPGARAYIKSRIKELAEVKGLASVHLDYIRFCDVVLGADLQPLYKLDQSTEMPEYDFGYHPEAIKQYKALFGMDPHDIKYPELDPEWRQFRMNAITSLVNELAVIAHQEGTKISAAVFPFPERARGMVRQDWSSWDIDLFCPMNYQSFYRQNIPWIGFSVANGVREIRGRNEAYLSGLYVPALKTVDELKQAIMLSKDNGANGVSFFDGKTLSDDQLKMISELNKTLNP